MKSKLLLLTLIALISGCSTPVNDVEKTDIDVADLTNEQEEIVENEVPDIIEPDEIVPDIELLYSDFSTEQIKDLQQRILASKDYISVNGEFSTQLTDHLEQIKSENNSEYIGISSIEKSIYDSFIEETSVFFADIEKEALMLTNKIFTLRYDYVPKNLRMANVLSSKEIELEGETATATEALFEAAKQAGHTLVLVSGYRDFEYQLGLFERKVSAVGISEANQFVAIPGESEHQTGYAIDISTHSMNLSLYQKFENEPEFEWLIENCADYGFILRYLKDKSDITGYSYEPWHYRYIGDVEIANYIMDNNLTFEEYYQQLDN